jgi:NADH-quinone oxidoreductase subunit H
MQPLAEIVKFATKEPSRPTGSIGILFRIAPMIAILTAIAGLALVPFGDVQHIFGQRVGLYGIDVSIGPLYVFAFAGISFYGIMIGGWSSGSKYSLLGAMRAAAQLISYEVAQALALVGVVVTAGTLSLTGIVHAQAGMWYLIPQFVGFIIFLVASFAETNRPPFDLVEAETELVGGYFTEYGGTAFVAYRFAEYMNMMVVSGIAVTMFLGGWLMPFALDRPLRSRRCPYRVRRSVRRALAFARSCWLVSGRPAWWGSRGYFIVPRRELALDSVVTTTTRFARDNCSWIASRNDSA